MKAAKSKSALADGHQERRAARERLAAHRDTVHETAEVLLRAIDGLEAEVKALEDERQKQRAEQAKVESDAAAKRKTERTEWQDRHQKISRRYDDITTRLTRAKDTLA